MRLTLLDTIGLVVMLGSSVAAQTTAKDVYLAYRAALATAKTMEAVRPYLAASAVAQVDATPAEAKPTLLGTLKQLAAANVTVIAETDAGSTHLLIVDGISGDDRPVR